MISWESRKHPIVSLSSSEALYMEATSTTFHVVWLIIILLDLTHEEEELTTIFWDNCSTITQSKNHVVHKKSTHIDTKFHFICEMVMNGEISLQFL